MLLVRRVEFDHALVRAAVAAGARVESGFEITQVETTADGVTLQARDGRRVSAPFVVAADGVHSVIAKRTGRECALAAHASRDRHDGGDAGRDAARRRGRTCCGWPTPTTASTATPTCFRRPRTSTSGSAACCRTSISKSMTAPYALQEQFVSSLIDAACFTADRIASASRRF